MKEITSNIYYVGVNDRNKNLFEGLWQHHTFQQQLAISPRQC
jgi:hypothetical protein